MKYLLSAIMLVPFLMSGSAKAACTSELVKKLSSERPYYITLSEAVGSLLKNQKYRVHYISEERSFLVYGYTYFQRVYGYYSAKRMNADVSKCEISLWGAVFIAEEDDMVKLKAAPNTSGTIQYL